MSIGSMTNAALARRVDFAPAGVPEKLNEIAGSALEAVPTNASDTSKKTASATDTALNVIFGYIPTEVLTLYVAVVAAVQKPSPSCPVYGGYSTFWVFLVATPVVIWIVFASKLKNADKPLPTSFSTWPSWEMFAGAAAVAAWAGALPNRPFQCLGGYQPGLPSFRS